MRTQTYTHSFVDEKFMTVNLTMKHLGSYIKIYAITIRTFVKN